MPFNTDHWDSMRQYEERIQELREQAKEEGIELSEASVNAAMSFLSNLTPAQGGENPSRLLKHRDPDNPIQDDPIQDDPIPDDPIPDDPIPDDSTPDDPIDEWSIPPLQG